MKKTHLPAFLFALALIIFPGISHADYFVWDDEKTGVSMTFPDRWELSHNQKPGDIITILGPSDYLDSPQCRLNVTHDGRYEVFPPRLYRAIQKLTYSKEFWEGALLAHYPDAKVLQFGDNAGIGRAFGSYVIVDYMDDRFPEPVPMRAITTVGIFGENAYMFECKALRGGFDKWRPLFQSIGASVEMDAVFATQRHGFYRDFINK